MEKTKHSHPGQNKDEQISGQTSHNNHKISKKPATKKGHGHTDPSNPGMNKPKQ
ncbi:hypothetical protein [Legionella jordanis]|uniref:Acid-soluble spore protein P n=1 Tax=Legionella jordanis TaxID=456 RepID=A0A0W0VAY7_9GAMM|nr:hypothetical protein [Legionella jordanis]KTD17264.1 hypothetical protein Ljor_1570 [Legionella jordanis]VEH12539.1 Uncharacterised protein [Legionella jordanis]